MRLLFSNETRIEKFVFLKEKFQIDCSIDSKNVVFKANNLA